MDWIIQGEQVGIRHMEDSPQDFSLFLSWMTDPETMKYWDGLTQHYTYEKVVERYREHIAQQIAQCIIQHQGQPVGFCQFYRTDPREYEVPPEQYYRFIRPQERVYGVDLFLGQADCRNRGIGTQSLKLLTQALFEQYHADVVLLDPKVHNARAIHCYHNCGFQDYFVVPQRELQDGVLHDSLIMGLRRPGL